MPVQLVMFDIGNVLIKWDPERFYDARIGRERREALFAQVDLDGMNDLIDLGEDFRATVYSAAERTPEWADEIRMWHDNWIDIAHAGIERSARLLRALRAKGVPVQALTNFGVEPLEIASGVYEYLNEFDVRYVSGELRAVKPGQRIYEIAEERCGFDPSAILFADDRAENITTAKARGWQTHLFEGPDGWADRLVAEGLLSAEEAA